MNPRSFMPRLVVFSLLWFALALGLPVPVAAQAAPEVTTRGPFSETELIKGLAGGMSNKRLVTLVGEYGVDFSLTPESEERLRAVGADDELVEAVRKGKAKPLSEADLLKRLAGGMESKRLVTQVSQYGVDFSSTPEIEERLRAAGAGDELVEAIRKAKLTPKTPAQAAAAPPAQAAPAAPALPGQGRTKVNPKDGLTYVWIPPGSFQMGCSPGDSECYSEGSLAHTVTITKGFWMGQTEVTYAAYKRVIGRIESSIFKLDRLPIADVTWYQANDYCRAVGMRLPTEAEWEYAARAGSTASRYGDLDAIAWYEGNTEENPEAKQKLKQEVGQKQPNAWKLYDMLGNVSEWVEDLDSSHPGWGLRVFRGGSYNYHAAGVRVSRRASMKPEYFQRDLGFRCAGKVP